MVTCSMRPPWGRCCILVAQLWGVGFWVGLFVQSIASLAPRSLDPFRRQDLSSEQWVAYAAIALGLWLCEGLGAFQRSFSPQLVRRAKELGPFSPIHELLLSPFFVAGMFAARARRLVKSWALIAVLVPGLALTVPWLPYPWREMVDGGVVLGLGWGTAVIVVLYARALLTNRWPVIDPDMPRSRSQWPEAKPGETLSNLQPQQQQQQQLEQPLDGA